MLKALDLRCEGGPENPFDADRVFCFDARSMFFLDDGKNLLDIRMPFADCAFDYITLFDLSTQFRADTCASFEGADIFAWLTSEAYRLLKPGGIFLIHARIDLFDFLFKNKENVDLPSKDGFLKKLNELRSKYDKYHIHESFDLRLFERDKHSILHVGLCKRVDNIDAEWPQPIVEKISVVVPVFNGGKYITQTINSLFAQNHLDFEILCVDDCSTDNSLAILQKLAENDARLKIFKTDRNLGSAPRVLNFALPLMTGAYFVYASQDDLFSIDWLAGMHARAKETGADAVIPDVTFFYENEPQRNKTLIGLNGDRSVQLTGRDAVMNSLEWKIPGNALWNAGLIKKFGFAEFAMNSDEYSVRLFFNACRKVVFSKGEFLYRQDNENAVTKKKNSRYFDFSFTHLRLAQWLFEQNYPKELIQQEFKNSKRGMTKMLRWYKEARLSMSLSEIKGADDRIARYRYALKKMHPLGKLPLGFLKWL